MINPKKELFKWGPIDGKILYIYSSFMDILDLYQSSLHESWPDVICYTNDMKTIVVIDNLHLREHGKKLFNKFILPKKKCTKIYKLWFAIAEKIAALCYTHQNSDLSTLSQQELSAKLQEFYLLYGQFWVYGFIPEIANWGGEKLLTEYIQKNYPENFNDIVEVLTAPEDFSFYQVEEKELLKEKIEDHANKYFWIDNSYGGVKFVDVEEFKRRKKALSAVKVKEIDQFAAKSKNKKTEIKTKYIIPKKIMQLASRLSFSIWWQDLRKKYIFMGLHVIHHFAKEIARRNNLAIGDVELYGLHEFLRLAKEGKKIDLRNRKKGYLSYYHEQGNMIMYKEGDEANVFIKPYADVKVDINVKELKGIVTSKGKARGYARILSGARHFDSMRHGEILVTSMTSPEFIVAMRKAAAIVTDEGGLTCHAAIISRELGIPCIVGTRVATRVLKTGDLVEVDADKGVVRKVDAEKGVVRKIDAEKEIVKIIKRS